MRLKVYFYLPHDKNLTIPNSIHTYWDWQSKCSGLSPFWGRYHWVLQTFLYLKDAQDSFDCILTNEIPQNGIMITHQDCIDYDFVPENQVYLIVMLVDRTVPSPYADMHVVHNPLQKLPFCMPSYYIPPWPQIGLIPRDNQRKDKFENVAFFGYEQSLVPELKDPLFQDKLALMGMTLKIVPPPDWNDFSNVDCIMAIRSFGKINCHLNKPALKLYNAWLAQVPAILGYESAYRIDGKPGYNYLEATSVDEILECLRKLKESAAYRNEIVEAGNLAVKMFSPEETIQRWSYFFTQQISDKFEAKQNNSLKTQFSNALGKIRSKILWRKGNWFDYQV